MPDATPQNDAYVNGDNVTVRDLVHRDDRPHGQIIDQDNLGGWRKVRWDDGTVTWSRTDLLVPDAR